MDGDLPVDSLVKNMVKIVITNNYESQHEVTRCLSISSAEQRKSLTWDILSADELPRTEQRMNMARDMVLA